MKLHCTISDGSEFDIQLIEHPFVHEWAQSVVKLELLPTELTGITGIGRKDPDYFIANLNYLLGIIDEAIDLGIKVPQELIYPLPQFEDDGAVIQQWANKLHRWCVFSQMKIPYPLGYFKWSIGKTIPYPLNSSAIEFINAHESSNIPGGLFNKINGAVHKFECAYDHPGRNILQDNNKRYWDQAFNLHYLKRYMRYGNDWKKEVKDLLSNDYYTVWMAKRILGKDWRECYMDQDDPTKIDIVNIENSIQYAFEIDLNDWRQFYYGENFLNWLAKYNIEYDVTKMGRIPLGNVLIEHEELQQKINNNETITTLQIR